MSWDSADKTYALNQLIDSCDSAHVRHIMAVIEPQFQRDFISLLPKEVCYSLTAQWFTRPIWPAEFFHLFAKWSLTPRIVILAHTATESAVFVLTALFDVIYYHQYINVPSG